MAETRSIQAGVVIPALQAGISAGLAALAVGAAGRMLELQSWKDGAIMAAGAAGAGVWIWQLQAWTDHLRQEVRWLTGDQAAEPMPMAAPEPIPAAPFKVHLTHDDNRTIEIIDLPTTPEKLAQLARAVLDGGTFSEAQWTGSGAPFTRAEFGQLRTELIRRHLLAWAAPGTPARGVVLTRPGQAAFRYFASLTSLPPEVR